jgi:hypothetical protein
MAKMAMKYTILSVSMSKDGHEVHHLLEVPTQDSFIEAF